MVGIAHSSSLVYLDISENLISDKGTANILNTLSECSKLRVLNMACNNQGAHTLHELKELFKNPNQPPKWSIVVLQLGNFVQEISKLGKNKDG